MDGKSPQTAHLIGACGAGMTALAELLLDSNWSLSGSDLLPVTPAIQKLVQRGFVFHQGHHESNLPPLAQFVIYSPAIPAANSERVEANRLAISQFSYGQMVGRLMRECQGVCLAGTHGKSTTTAMTATILKSAGRLSASVMGAQLCESGRSGLCGSGDLFVAESCEFQRSFLEFQPKYSAILGIEPDHLDCYPDLESLSLAFREFADQTSDEGILLFNNECETSRSVAHRLALKGKASFLWSPFQCGLDGHDHEPTNAGVRFTLSHHQKRICEIDLILHGRHNVMNALAAAALCHEIGVSLDVIRTTLASFRGIRRRFELVGERNGVTYFDDYAHHPTAVKVTLETLRNRVGTRPIRCVFQPHQVLRTTALMDQFAQSFSDADDVLLAPVFAARESVLDQPYLVSRELARRIALNGTVANSFSSLDQIVSTLEDSTRPGDVIVTMGAGDIDRIHYEFTRRVQ